MSSTSKITTADNNDESALLQLLAPDGYYRYLGVTKPPPVVSGNAATSDDSTSSTSGTAKDEHQIFLETVKRNYRKLSLKHHPDKSTGNVDTFRLLHRAQRVLLDPKLRNQYDLLGIDLNDDDTIDDNTTNTAPNENSSTTNHSSTNNNNNNNSDHDDDDDNNKHHNSSSSSSYSSPQGMMQEIASNILATVLQLGVRTTLMGIVSVILVRYWFTVYPTYLFLFYTIYRMISLQSQVVGGSIYDTIPTSGIALGIFFMHRSILNNHHNNVTTIASSSSSSSSWNTQFWIGEALVIGMFIYNSLTGISILSSLKPMIVWGVITIISLLFALWFRGNIWNYCIVIVMIGIVAIIVAMAFPIMEIIVESILQEKLRKVGDKVRYHHQMIHSYYEKKYNIQR